MGILKNGKYEISYPSSVDYLENVEAITVEIAKEAGFDESTIDDISIAITELFNNAIHHGNQNDVNKKVHLLYTLSGNALKISIQDEGSGFEPDQLRDPLAPENILADNGRGIYLVKMLMDKVHFNITNKGSEIIITKHL